jgi:hypothetical protein
MWRFGQAVLLLLGVIGPALGTPAAGLATPPGQLCQRAIQAAERGSFVPAHLLAAIGRVESGRRDPVGGDWRPWPWTVNAGGEGLFYDTKAQAIAAVRALQARGERSIDVGCMQVNLAQHPDAFPSLEMAFEPRENAAYAARFLEVLHARGGDWSEAAARYHSATADLGADYQRKVLAVWPMEARRTRRDAASALARAWGATLGGASGGELGADRRRVLADGGHRSERAWSVAGQDRGGGE